MKIVSQKSVKSIYQFRDDIHISMAYLFLSNAGNDINDHRYQNELNSGCISILPVSDRREFFCIKNSLNL